MKKKSAATLHFLGQKRSGPPLTKLGNQVEEVLQSQQPPFWWLICKLDKFLLQWAHLAV
jgi:hypothetical protein